MNLNVCLGNEIVYRKKKNGKYLIVTRSLVLFFMDVMVMKLQ